MITSNNIQMVDINDLNLDTQNPRIRRFIEMYGDSPSEIQMMSALDTGVYDPEDSDKPTFNSLKQSIKTNGSIVQPIIVNKDEAGKLVVIEGNTRLAIYKEFNSSGVHGDWSKIPCIVNDNLSKPAMDAIRLQAHLVGPRPWDPYSKAKYLHSLSVNENLPLSVIIDFCGGKAKEIQTYIDAFSDIEKYYRPIVENHGEPFDTTRFSGFVELQKSGVKQAIIGNGFTLDDFAGWIRESKIDPLNTVRSLPSILSNTRAKEVFLNEGAKEAKKIIDMPESPSLKQFALEPLLQAVINKLNSIQNSDVKRLRKEPNSTLALLILDAKEIFAELSEEISED